MVKYFLYISLSLLTFNLSLAKNIDIQEDIKIDYVCKFEKKILKNLEHNYKTFLAKDLNEENLNKLEINAKQPEMLLINGLSTFLSKNKKLDVKVVNKDIVLFKAFDKDKNYSESGIMNRNSGEFVQETTKDLKSDNFKKDISFYKCTLQV